MKNTIVKELVIALNSFFFGRLFPTLQKNDFYIMGESYAGKYVPNLAASLIGSGSQVIPRVKGIAIGNGLVDPLSQVGVFSDFHYQTGLIGEAQYLQAKHIQLEAQRYILNNDFVNANAAFSNVTDFVYMAAGAPDPADIRQYGYGSYVVYDNLISFANKTSTRNFLGVGNTPFNLCSDTVQKYLVADEMRTSIHNVEKLLNNNIKVLIFNGNFDFTIPVSTTNAWLSKLNWKGKTQFSQASRSVWTDNQQNTIGYYKGTPLLKQVIVVLAGHVVCQDQPKVSHMMINNFIYDLPFK